MEKNNELQNAEDNIVGLKLKLGIAERDLNALIIKESKRVLQKHCFEFSDSTTMMYYSKKKDEFIQVSKNGMGSIISNETLISIYKVNHKFRTFLKSY